MFPDTVGAVAGLLFVIAPGLVFEIIRGHYLPSAQRSTFREIAAVALASVVFTVAVLVLFGVTRYFTPELVPDARAWLEDGASYLSDNFTLVAVSAVVLVASSIGLSALVAWLRFRQYGGNINPNTTGWFEVLQRATPKEESDPVVRVTLQDGTVYSGRVISYSPGPEAADRELILGPPLLWKAPNATAYRPLTATDKWKRVLIPSSSIEVMWVTYDRRR